MTELTKSEPASIRDATAKVKRVTIFLLPSFKTAKKTALPYILLTSVLSISLYFMHIGSLPFSVLKEYSLS